MKSLNNYINEVLVKQNLKDTLSIIRVLDEPGTKLYYNEKKHEFSLEENDDCKLIGINLGITSKTGKATWMYIDNGSNKTIFRNPWAKKYTKLYTAVIDDDNDGYKNTNEILSKYNNDIMGTLWEIINKINKEGEYEVYLPAAIELYDIVRRKKLLKIIGDTYPTFASSTTDYQSKSDWANETVYLASYNNGKCNKYVSTKKEAMLEHILLIKL